MAKYTTPSELQKAIDKVNRSKELDVKEYRLRETAHLVDETTKGWTIRQRWDKMELCTDYERFKEIAEEYTPEQPIFKDMVLKIISKGGTDYLNELKEKYNKEEKP